MNDDTPRDVRLDQRIPAELVRLRFPWEQRLRVPFSLQDSEPANALKCLFHIRT